MVQNAHTFLFADLCGFTEHTWRLGDDWSAEVAVSFHALVRSLAVQDGCEVLSAIGDAVMVHSLEVGGAIRLAHRIHRGAAVAGLPQVRIGIDSGPAVPRAGDWYGTTVNTAARVAKAAVPGELLLTQRACQLAEAEASDAVESGQRALKGLPACFVFAAPAPALEPAYSFIH